MFYMIRILNFKHLTVASHSNIEIKQIIEINSNIKN